MSTHIVICSKKICIREPNAINRNKAMIYIRVKRHNRKTTFI